jgi:hypothetical protein
MALLIHLQLSGEDIQPTALLWVLSTPSLFTRTTGNEAWLSIQNPNRISQS